jgi:hypothetical protein
MSITGYGAAVISAGYGSTLSQWRVLNSTMDRQMTLVTNDRQNKADAEYASQKLPTVASVDDLMDDRRLYTYVMRAFGLEDQINSQALIRKVLESDLSDTSSYASRLNDTRYKELAAAFNFGGSSSESSFTSQIKDAYITQAFEESLATKNEALTMALDFTRRAATKTSWAEVLADDDLAEVARLAFGLEEPYGPVDEASQAASLESAMPFSDYLNDTTKQDNVRQGFFGAWDTQNGSGSVLSSSSQYTMLMRNYDQQKANYAASWSIRSNVTYLEQKLSAGVSSDDLLKDSKLRGIVLKAFDLEQYASNTTYVRQVLESDPNDSTSFAVKAGENEESLALSFGSNNTGVMRRGSPAFVNNIISRYEEMSFEVSAGNTNEALRLGLYFERKAEDIGSWYSVLADEALSEVVRTAFGLPDEIAQADIDKQVSMLQKRFDITKLKDPAEVTKLVDKFMMMWDLEGNSSSTTSSSPTLQLFSGRTTIDSSTLLAALTLPRT